MKKKLLTKRVQFLIRKYKTICILSLFVLACSVAAHAQIAHIAVPSSRVKLVKTFKINSRAEAPPLIDPNAIYSNISSFTGNALANEFAALQDENTITSLVADSLGLPGSFPFSVGSFTFSVANFNNVAVTARPLIRFYAADGTGGAPGTLIAAYDFDPILFNSATIGLFSGTVDPFTITTGSVWAGITFDNDGGTTGATLMQMNNLGQGVFDPIDKGSSTDGYFATDDAGSFLDDNPVGSVYAFEDNSPANLGWEIISAVTLPVTFNNFKGQRNGSVNSLTWNTSQELNSNYFSIERSNDGISFTKIGEVKAAGSSSVSHNYQFNDPNPVKGINYYRLRIVDINNSGRYSGVVRVRNTGVVNLTLYPNPVKSTMLVNMDAEKEETARVSITDNSGRKVYNRQIAITRGNNNFPVDVSTLSRGTYYFKVQLSSGALIRKFNKL